MSDDLENLTAEIKKLKNANLSLTLKYNKMKTHTINEIINDTKTFFPHNSLQVNDPQATTAAVAYTPAQVQSAYSLNSIVTPNNALRGTGIKVGVIIAYHYPNLQVDFNKFCTLYSLPASTLTVVNLAGKSTNNSWALEECLDVQMIHTAAPGAQITVYEANGATNSALNTAIQQAITGGMDIISMSWGSSEFSTQSDSQFTASGNVCFLASAGDSSYEVCFPSSSSNVLALGGTTLTLDGNNARTNETVWSSAGGGVSLYTAKPSYQSNFNTSYNTRCVPDISLIADPNTGVNVICSAYSSSPIPIGGTSVSCPLFAGFLATVNQVRLANNKTKLTTIASKSNNFQNMLYNSIYPNNKTSLYDITSGSDSIFNAAVGYDIISGVGSFRGDLLCAALATL